MSKRLERFFKALAGLTVEDLREMDADARDMLVELSRQHAQPARRRVLLGHRPEKKIDAIKALRACTGMMLKEAKDAVEGVREIKVNEVVYQRLRKEFVQAGGMIMRIDGGPLASC